VRVTPDGARYLALAGRRPVPRPFCYRWLAPTLYRRSLTAWRVGTIVAVLVAAVATGFLADGWERGLAAGSMFAAMPMNRFNMRNPVLVDATAIALAVSAAVAWKEGLWPLGVALILVSGMVKETAPVFGALYAWVPVLLVGLLAPAVRALLTRPGPDVLDAENAWILRHPLQASRKYHHGKWLSGVMIAPWGGAIVSLAALDWRLGLLLAVSYAQLLVATDTVRLYQWAAPALCVAAAAVVPVVWLPVLVAVTVWNPLAGDGV
jgi:hypothetical protein